LAVSGDSSYLSRTPLIPDIDKSKRRVRHRAVG